MSSIVWRDEETMKTTINGQEAECQLRGDESAVEVLRGHLGLSGTKLACGTGACGACTILVDGVPMASCVLPAHKLEGRKVETIEGYGEERLHPIQRALMATDGLQCGYCTPGFVMESIAFFGRWRAAHGKSKPPREEVMEALAGHLCRCGAYAGIVEGVTRACAGEFDGEEKVEAARVDALVKVTGKARYTVDIRHPGQLVGKVLRATHGHATLRRVDLTAAKGLKGVGAVVDLCDGETTIRYVGQPIAAVAAIDEETAQRALAAIEVEWEALPVVVGLDAARAEGALEVCPKSARGGLGNSSEGPILPGAWDVNTRTPRMELFSQKPKQAKRAIEAAKASGTPLIEGRWHTPAQIHTCLEPHSAVAQWHEDGSLTVHTSTQACAHIAHQLAKRFRLPLHKVEVRCEYIGGAFGSKLGLTSELISAILLARESGAPVGVVFSRSEEMTVGGYRPATEVELSLAASPEGEWQGLQVRTFADAGAAVNSVVTMQMGAVYTRGTQPRSLIDLDVLTHNAPGTPFRGPGGPAACFSLEAAIDQMAFALQVDPIQLRRNWDDHPIRGQVLDWVEALPAWKERVAYGAQTGRFRRGIGVALGYWSYYYDPESTIELEVTPDELCARTASQDMGNGTYTLIARAIAEILQIAPSSIRVELGSSRAVYGPTAGGSRSANSLFAPAQEAATKIRDAFLKAAQKAWKGETIQPVSGGLQVGQKQMSWRELAQALGVQKAVAKRGTDRFLESIGKVVMKQMGMELVIGKGNTAGAYVTELEIDMRLGKIRPVRVWGVMAVGRIFVPALARSQCYGGIIQGLGHALYEEKLVDARTGAVLTANMEDYRIPGIAETPEMTVEFLEGGFAHAKGDGVGLAELATLPVAASVANAIFHATGWRPMTAPITPQRLLEGVQGQ